jgi:hypothetical protein
MKLTPTWLLLKPTALRWPLLKQRCEGL